MLTLLRSNKKTKNNYSFFTFSCQQQNFKKNNYIKKFYRKNFNLLFILWLIAKTFIACKYFCRRNFKEVNGNILVRIIIFFLGIICHRYLLFDFAPRLKNFIRSRLRYPCQFFIAFITEIYFEPFFVCLFLI